MKLTSKTLFTYICGLLCLGLITSCSESVTNVWEYYVKNSIERHDPGMLGTSKAKLLYRHQEEINKAQVELVAYKNDKMKCMVIGSHKIVKQFYLYDSLYYFDVNDLYSNVRGNDFIRQMGDLSIFFTQVPVERCDAFLVNVDKLKSLYMTSGYSEGMTSYFDYALSPDVFVSIEKKSTTEQLDNASVVLWVGRRRHQVKLQEFVRACQELKAFN